MLGQPINFTNTISKIPTQYTRSSSCCINDTIINKISRILEPLLTKPNTIDEAST